MPIHKRHRGFTLMELVLVMTILAILTSVGIVGYRSHRKHAQEAVLKENLYQLNHALECHRADKGKYPASLDALRGGYLREIPLDPFTSQANWNTEMEPPDPDQPDAEAGIWRVRSSSEDIGSDGKPYSDW